jgi:putative membrane protein
MWHNGSGWWWVVGLLTALIVVGGLIGLLTLLAQRGPVVPRIGPDPELEAERILDQRYARGEIDDAEYQHRLHVLRRTAAGTAPS